MTQDSVGAAKAALMMHLEIAKQRLLGCVDTSPEKADSLDVPVKAKGDLLKEPPPKVLANENMSGKLDASELSALMASVPKAIPPKPASPATSGEEVSFSTTQFLGDQNPLLSAFQGNISVPFVPSPPPSLQVAPLPINAGADAQTAKCTPPKAFASKDAATQALSMSAMATNLPQAAAQLAMARQSASFTGLEMLAAAASKEAEKEAVSKEASSARPMSGYARASITNRRVECNLLAGQDTGAQIVDADGPVSGGTADVTATHTGDRGASGKAGAVAQKHSAPDALTQKVFLGNIPRGTGEGLIRAECLKHGQVTSILYNMDPGDLFKAGWAIVCYVTAEMATIAVQKMKRQAGLFGSSEPVTVRMSTAEDEIQQLNLQTQDTQIEHKHATADLPQISRSKARDEQTAAGCSRSKSHDKSQSRGRNHSNSRTRCCDGRSRRGTGRKHRGRHRVSRSRSCSRRRSRRRRHGHRSGRRRRSRSGGTASGANCSSPVSEAVAVKRQPAPGGFDSGPCSDASAKPTGGRQIAVRGEWAQFAIASGRYYYQNMTTNETSWEVPSGFRTQHSRRAGDYSGAPSRTKLFIYHLPFTWDEERLLQRFSPFGQIMSVMIQRDASGQHRGSGFVTFSTYDEAQSAINSMDGYFIDGLRLKVAQSRY